MTLLEHTKDSDTIMDINLEMINKTKLETL